MSSQQPTMTIEDFTRTAGAVRTAMLALGKAVDDAGIEKSLTELVKLRASQINGCVFCLKLHLEFARKYGIAAEKIDMVAAWREAGLFSPREMAALAWTETLTRMPPEGPSPDAYAALREHFSADEITFLTVAIGTINQWNRIAVGLRFAPPASRDARAA